MSQALALHRRYPICWHIAGAGAGEHARANSIHDSFHHAVVIHSTNDVLVERNVAYDTNSHTFVIGIGHEEPLSGIHHSGHQSGGGAVPSHHRGRRTRGVPRPW
jgi:hypothetical protein